MVSNICVFSPLFGEDEPILTNIIFQMGWLKPPTSDMSTYSISLDSNLVNCFFKRSSGPTIAWKVCPPGSKARAPHGSGLRRFPTKTGWLMLDRCICGAHAVRLLNGRRRNNEKTRPGDLDGLSFFSVGHFLFKCPTVSYFIILPICLFPGCK